MAPDINALADYSAPGSTGYNIPDTTVFQPENRKLRVLCIGGGVSGIMMAYQIQKYCSNVELKIFEKNADIGGTWLENRYPGCACDIPSHAYTYNFALNPDWPRFFSYSPDIWKYLDKVCETFDIRKYITFNNEVVGCYWEDDKGEWRVKLKESLPGKEPREYEETCDLLLHATGILNNFKWPKIDGLEKFKGRLVHTARWPKDYKEEDWKKDSVAIIGSGASSIQTLPTMQPHVKHIDVFVRTAVWFVQIANNYGQNKEYSAEEQKDFRKDPESLVAHAKDIEDQINGLWGAFYSDTPMQEFTRKLFADRMAEFIKDERLLKGFTPKFGVGCRRVTPGDPYMKAIQEPNVDVHFTPVESVTEHGVVGGDGVERKVDTIVCATGFDVTYRPRFPLVGKNGLDLKDKWAVCPESYLGVGIPDFPNFITFIGPTWPVENGSVMGPLLTVGEYAIQIIKKMQNENIKSWEPKQDVTDSFNEHVQEWVKHTVWKDGCRSWYRNNETGRVNAIWPGASLHYQQIIRQPRYEDFHIKYHNTVNQWAWLGMGWTKSIKVNLAAAAAEQDAAAKNLPKPDVKRMDVSTYINVRNMDPRWMAAHGMDPQEAKESVIKAYGDWAMQVKREEIERMEKGEGADSTNTSGYDANVI